MSSNFITNAVVIIKVLFERTISFRVSSIKSKISEVFMCSAINSFEIFAINIAQVAFSKFSLKMPKLFSCFISVIIMFFGPWYRLKSQKFKVSIAPVNFDESLSAPFAIALIFPWSRV